MEAVFRILGPLEVTIDERVVSFGGRRERAILGILLLNLGEVVSVERLIDGVWGEARPSSAKHMLHEYVSRLRPALAEAASISTRPPGYVLELSEDLLDVRQFVRLMAAARAAAREQRHAQALSSYDQALALWRGDALADVGLEGQSQIAAERLNGERLLVGEERIDCALALGRHLQVIPELQHRVEQVPLRERSRAQLMLALYRAGRQVEALERYREGRALLVEQAGVEPGPELRELERAILQHDPALELAPSTRSDDRSASVTGRARRRSSRVGIAGALVAAAVGALVFVVHDSGNALARIDANSAGAIDPGSNRLVDQVRVGVGPGRIAAGFASLWVVNSFDSTVSRIDPATGTVVDSITVDADPTAIAVAGGFVWVACTGTRSVNRIDPNVNRVTQRAPVGNGSSGIAISPGALWVTNRLDDTVTEIDSATGKSRRTLAAGPSPSDIAYGFDALWIANESSSTVTRLDPVTGGLQTVGVGNGPEAVAIGEGSVWVANSLNGTVSRIDPGSNSETAAIPVGLGPSSVLARDGAVWVAVRYGGRVVRIDPRTNSVVRAISVGSGPHSLTSIGGRVWLSARETASVHRGGTLRMFSKEPPDSLDVARGYSNGSWLVFSVTGDGLVGYKRAGGLAGATLVPDLATSLPTPTDGGRTYTFQLRRGIRYSNGDPVRASDLRRALERVFRMRSAGVQFYRGLVGADSCSRRRCDLSRGVVTDDRTGTVILHLRKPDPEITYKLALAFANPVPRAVPMTRPARFGVPGTGPYMLQSYTHVRLVLVRNPHFRASSSGARPDGYPDRIVVTYRGAVDDQLTAVEQGKADVIYPPRSRLDEIRTRYAAQVHVFPGASVDAIFLNTRVPPFDNLAARQAFNYAIDRGKAVAGYGGGGLAAATCQIMPAGMNGYQPYCRYTRNPTVNGVWKGPDLARARSLVSASGTRGQNVVVWTIAGYPWTLALGNLAVATLERLGYRTSLKAVPLKRYFYLVGNSRTRAQTGYFGWAQDYPAASSFLTAFTCTAFEPANEDNTNPNVSELCDQRVDQAVDRALARQTPDAPVGSSAAWAAVDRLVTDIAPWVPLVNGRQVVFVSRRVGNVQANSQWGLLIDQMWVK